MLFVNQSAYTNGAQIYIAYMPIAYREGIKIVTFLILIAVEIVKLILDVSWLDVLWRDVSWTGRFVTGHFAGRHFMPDVL